MKKTQLLERRMQETAQQWAQAHARQLLTHMRARARMKATHRREYANRCRLLGQFVNELGDPNWSPTELAGVLLEARESLASPTMRLAAKQRGEAHFARQAGRGALASAAPQDRGSGQTAEEGFPPTD